MSRPDESPPSEPELTALLADVRYEVGQFQFGVLRVAAIDSQIEFSKAERNAHVEAMLIHCRCLVDFFLCDPKKDDVVASHYISDWSPQNDGGDELRWLEAQLGTFIDKRVAHLTAYRQRVSKEDDVELVQDVIERMAVVVDRFRERLSPELQALFSPAAGA